jgi:hypothetical protein
MRQMDGALEVHALLAGSKLPNVLCYRNVSPHALSSLCVRAVSFLKETLHVNVCV